MFVTRSHGEQLVQNKILNTTINDCTNLLQHTQIMYLLQLYYKLHSRGKCAAWLRDQLPMSREQSLFYITNDFPQTARSTRINVLLVVNFRNAPFGQKLMETKHVSSFLSEVRLTFSAIRD